MRPDRLIIGIGNPSRGDDALGPRLIERLEVLALPDVELLTDFQLQVEYVLDLHGRREIIFVDAAASGTAPCTFAPVEPERDTSFSSHALSAPALLAAYAQHFGDAPPPSYLLAIRGYAFELGAALSRQAHGNLDVALRLVMQRLRANIPT